MSREKFDSILQRYLNDQCSEVERQYVESWLEATQQTDVKELDPRERAKLREKLWTSIEKGLGTDTLIRSVNYWKISKIAAVLLLVAAGVFSLSYYLTTSSSDDNSMMALNSNPEMISVTNNENVNREIELKDGSKVSLRPGSELKYLSTFGELREVYLSGEAFFNIKKDPEHPFLVHADEVTTRVLGTSFLVKAFQDQKEIMVAVSSGRVSVSSKASASLFNLWNRKNEVVLTPNQQLVYNRNEKTTHTQLVNNPRMLIPNASRELVYNNEPVTKLFKALEKIYGVIIRHDEKMLANCTITTEMTDEGLFERMDVICHVLNARYNVIGTTIIVESSGCSN